MKRQQILFASLSVLSLCSLKPVLAQDVVDGSLQEITVTAQRREEKIQSVPLAITAFNAESLEDRQIHETLDLVHFVPNMIGHNNTGLGTANTYYLRGLGNTESIGTFDPPVGTYVDDVYIARQNLNNFGLFDIDRVEVLRGPQGTLFGRNTTGGAIDIILKKPSDHYTGYVEAETAKDNEIGGRASVDVPISPMVLTKFSFFGQTDDGYAKQVSTGRDINSDKTYGLRAAIRFLPTDSITWDVEADNIYESYTNQLNVLDANGERVTHSGLVQGALVRYFTGNKARISPFTNDVDSTAGTSNLTIDLEGVSLQSITGYRKTRQVFLTDSFGELATGVFATGGSPNDTYGQYEQYSQEFKASGALLNDKLNYTAGFYFMRENVLTDLASGSTGATGLFTVIADRSVHNSTDAKAVYAQFDYHVSDEIVATLGGRFTDEMKRISADRNPGALGAAISTNGIAAAGIPLSLHAPIFTPHAGLEYHYDPDTMFYATITRGFKSGGWNARATSNAAFTTFTPEKIWSEELGMRSELFDKTLRVNITGFYSYDEKIQIPASVFINGAPVYTTTNPADLEVYGGEFEVTWLPPIEHLTITNSLGVSSAAYQNPNANVVKQQAACKANPGTTANSNCNAGFVDINGNLATPVRIPPVTWNMLVSYEWEAGPVTITPTADISLEAAYSIGTSGSEASSLSSFATVRGNWVSTQWLLNLGVKFQPTNNKNLSITAECRNCLMKDYPVSFLPPFQFLDKPGTWDFRAHYSF
jgi:iron complex outermembrane receptor protein